MEKKGQDNTEAIDFTKHNYYWIKSLKKRESVTDQLIELQVYGTTKENIFLYQAKHFSGTGIDSLNSHFYNLDFKEYQPFNYKGHLDVVYEKKKLLNIEFKAITSANTEEDKILSFKSNGSNRVNFSFFNTNSEHKIKGVLCITIET